MAGSQDKGVDYSLYLVTDSALVRSGTLETAVAQACEGGVTVVQLREKRMHGTELAALARNVKAVCDSFGVPLIVNDDVDVAAAVGVAGVHVGQRDASVAHARAVLGQNAIVGVSAHTVQEALAAERAGADYLGIGAMRPTSTKSDAQVVGREGLARILDTASIPCVAIGGICEQNIPEFAGMGVAGFAVVSAIMAAPDVRAAAHGLRLLIDGQGV